ncbi:MAG: CapA family protein [Lachnospiraceae bacterium]|nr:CapA family protein [Lachnospiraceae bacterium]
MSFDLTHTSNKSSFTDFANSGNICSDKRFINTLLAIGLDIVELTGNHNRDCGDQAAIETIDTYLQNGIKIVGGGKTAEEAAVPLEINEKGNGITMLAYNLSTGGATYDDTPGANQYYQEVAEAQIKEAKERGDVVIVDIQYYECNAYASTYEDPTCDRADSAAGDQVGFFRSLIDMGADVVVGTSAHQPQTFELYGNGVIYYGLGNLFFDQVCWPGTTRSLVLVHHFYKDKLLQTQIVPTVYGNEMQVGLMDGETAKWFLNRLMSVRP